MKADEVELQSHQVVCYKKERGKQWIDNLPSLRHAFESFVKKEKEEGGRKRKRMRSLMLGLERRRGGKDGVGEKGSRESEPSLLYMHFYTEREREMRLCKTIFQCDIPVCSGDIQRQSWGWWRIVAAAWGLRNPRDARTSMRRSIAGSRGAEGVLTMGAHVVVPSIRIRGHPLEPFVVAIHWQIWASSMSIHYTTFYFPFFFFFSRPREPIATYIQNESRYEWAAYFKR